MPVETPTVRDLILVLETYFPANLDIECVFGILATLSSIWALLRLHSNQAREPRQPQFTAWKKSTLPIIKAALRANRVDDSEEDSDDENARALEDTADTIYHDIEQIASLLGQDQDRGIQSLGSQRSQLLLITKRLDCKFCVLPDALRPRRSLRLDKNKNSVVHVLTEGLEWTKADLFVAECSHCLAMYYPDKITYKPEGGARMQTLEVDAEYLCISKSGVWVHRRIGFMEEKAMHRFTAGWSNFASWVNDLTASDRTLTRHQAKRLFVEHFSRRLLIAHGKVAMFECSPHPSTDTLTKTVRSIIGENGGVLPNALLHGCQDCTHRKRYRADLIAEGVIPADAGGDAGQQVADMPEQANNGNPGDEGNGNVMQDDGPPIPGPLLRPENQADEDPMYVQMAVMDGKTLGHRICALSDCRNPLMNYKNGRFCQTHFELSTKCGIIPCGQPIHHEGARTCNLPAHKGWGAAWETRFKRLVYSGVRRVMRRQREPPEGIAPGNPNHPMLEINLPPLGDTPGNDVVHTFRARTVYCVQTVQWACGMPIGWGKCYKAESQSQVLSIIDHIWEAEPGRRPAFLAYDDACGLLRHITTQQPNSLWLTASRLVVDAWHYIGHRSSDALCRTYCNPAPLDGSQPDLVRVCLDGDGQKHLTRAFNTETAEQFNAWLTGYEAQLRQMTDYSFDFFIHVLMLIFAESIEARIEEKGRELDNAE